MSKKSVVFVGMISEDNTLLLVSAFECDSQVKAERIAVSMSNIEGIPCKGVLKARIDKKTIVDSNELKSFINVGGNDNE